MIDIQDKVKDISTLNPYELKDYIIETYEKILDYDVVLNELGIGEETRVELDADPNFVNRMKHVSLQVKIDAMAALRAIAQGKAVNGSSAPKASDVVSANNILLEKFYPEKFSKNSNDDFASVREYSGVHVEIPNDGRVKKVSVSMTQGT